MTLTDFRLICTALGFTAMVIQDGKKVPNDEASIRAAGLAKLIEEFCRHTMPEAFDDEVGADFSDGDIDPKKGKFAIANRMASAIAEIMKEKGKCEPQDLTGRFTPQEVQRNWKVAHALAYVQLNKIDPTDA
jgi:hypothetical protein